MFTVSGIAIMVLAAGCLTLSLTALILRKKLRRERRQRDQDQASFEQTKQGLITSGERRLINQQARHDNVLRALRQQSEEQCNAAVEKAIDFADAIHRTDMANTQRSAVESDRLRERKRLQELIKAKEAEGLGLAGAGQIEASYLVLMEVLGLALSTNSAAAQASAWHNIAVITAKRGKLEEACQFLKHALCLSEKEPQRQDRIDLYKRHLLIVQESILRNKAQTVHQAAQVLLQQGNAEQSLKLFGEAAALAGSANNPVLQLAILNNAAAAYAAAELSADGVAALRQARSLLERLDAGEAELMGDMVDNNIQWLEDLAQSKQFRQLMHHAYTAADQDHFNVAEDFARQAYDEACSQFGGTHYRTAVALDALGVSAYKQGRAEESLGYFRHAYSVALEWPESAQRTLYTVSTHLKICRQFLGYEPPEEDTAE